jgi:hypothetical protein
MVELITAGESMVAFIPQEKGLLMGEEEGELLFNATGTNELLEKALGSSKLIER